MNNTYSRRQELLQQTRKDYTESSKIPLVHPRYASKDYGSTINSSEFNSAIYSMKNRVIIALILFIIFAGMDYNNSQISGVGSEEIISAVSTNIDTVNVFSSW